MTDFGASPSAADSGLASAGKITAMLSPAALAGPVLLQILFNHARHGRPPRLLEFLGLCAAIAVCAAGAMAVRRHKLSGTDLIPLAGFAAVVLLVLQHITFLAVPWDFDAYRHAAEAIAQSVTPYPDPSYYTYPPAFAEWVGGVERFWRWLLQIRPMGVDSWYATFYVMQAVQAAAVAIVYVVLYRFARACGMGEVPAALTITALLAFNEPLWLTISNSQVNMIMLAAILAGVALFGSADWAAGFLLAVPIVIKLYPATLLPAFLLLGYRRAVAWTCGWLAVLVLAARPLSLWLDFARLWMRPATYPTVSDGTIFNLLANGARFIGVSPVQRPLPAIRLVWILIVIGIMVWAAVRVVARVRAARHTGTPPQRLLFAVTADVLALNLFISPLVWPHHMVFALPLIVFGAATVPAARRLTVGAAAFLIFAIPWSDVFILGYHRMIGTVLGLWATPPRSERV